MTLTPEAAAALKAELADPKYVGHDDATIAAMLNAPVMPPPRKVTVPAQPAVAAVPAHDILVQDDLKPPRIHEIFLGIPGAPNAVDPTHLSDARSA